MESKRIKRLEDFYKGNVIILLHGGNIERFINLCEYQEISLRDVRNTQNRIYARITANDYRRLKAVFRKTGINPRIVKKEGLPFWLKKHKNQKNLLLCAALFLAGMYYLAGFLWRIELTGCYYHTQEQLRDFLKENGVFEGARKGAIQCPEIEREIRKEYPDIGWVSVELFGTVMKVRIQETKTPQLSASKIMDGRGESWSQENGHIVAACDGIISEIIVETGKAMVKPGDFVQKGEVLISGVLDIYGDNEILLERRPVLAQGRIVLKIAEKYSDSFPAEYERKVYEKEKISGLQIYAFHKKIFSYSSSNSMTECDIINRMEQYCIGDYFYLPIKVQKTYKHRYQTVTEHYSEEEATLLADQRLMRYLEKRKQNGAVLLSAEKKTEQIDDTYFTEARLVFLDSAWQYRTIDPMEWRISETNEYNTNGD